MRFIVQPMRRQAAPPIHAAMHSVPKPKPMRKGSADAFDMRGPSKIDDGFRHHQAEVVLQAIAQAVALVMRDCIAVAGAGRRRSRHPATAVGKVSISSAHRSNAPPLAKSKRA